MDLGRAGMSRADDAEAGDANQNANGQVEGYAPEFSHGNAGRTKPWIGDLH